MNKAKNREVYADWITRYYSSHKYIPDGHSDGELIGKLIRCKDCKHWDGKYHYCEIIDDSRDWDADDYCSVAERKEE